MKQKQRKISKWYSLNRTIHSLKSKIANLSFILLGLLISCNETIDIEKEKKLIIAQIGLVQEAHFKKDANLFYQPNADQWTDIRNGLLTNVSKKDKIESTQAYLDQMTFQQLEKITEPVIELSDDGTLASYSSNVIVKGVLAETPVFWVVAWQNVLRKIEGEWKIISAANTEATPGIMASVLLDQVRKHLGNVDSVKNIYALADCTGPEGNSFTTLIMSGKTAGRMEQLSGDRHQVFKHGEASWSYNVNTEDYSDSLSVFMHFFAKSHELHWLSMDPESRFSNMSFVDIVDFDGQKAFKISFVDENTNPVNFYYSFETYRPLAFDIQVSEKGDMVTVFFKEWEKEDGVLVFKKAIFDEDGKLFEYNFEEIAYNTLSASDFESKEPRLTK